MKDILQELNGKEYTVGIYDDYDIRMCREDEYDDLREFFKNYWRERHIFVLSKDVFDYQHLNKEKETYNFIIAREKNTNDIHAILGFVPNSQYDKNIKRTMVWPCIWKNRKDVNRKGLGVTMYYHLKNSFEIEAISILGISEVALSIYKHWNFGTGKIEQFVMPNFTMDDHLAKGLSEIYSSFDDDAEDKMSLYELSMEEYSSIDVDNSIFTVNNIYKSKDYYINRFLQHPVYKYIFLAIKKGNKIKAIIVARSCGDGTRNCLRIVDFIGDVCYLSGVRNQMQKYLQDKNYEYVDFIEVGLEKELLVEAGFINRKDYPEVVVPNYFEPFLQENIDLDYAYKTVVDDSKEIFFKADADQDRPNVLS